MYKILLWHYRDGFETDFPTEAKRTLYDDANASSTVTILSGTGKDSITELPTFDFTVLPNHPLYNEIVKFKTWITVYRNNRVLFHGRVLSDGLDFYGQRTVSCEGALGVLLDSVLDPISAQTETPKAHLQRLIQLHNAQMSKTPYPEPYKCFTVGNVTIDGAETSKKFEKVEGYTQTRSLIDDHLLGEYKGYLFTRYENGTLYLDWLKNFNRVNSQPVKMAVNMLDRSLEESADEYYTVMLPVGANKVTIDGKYLTDDAGIKKYGRIYKAESFSDKKRKADLLDKAQKEFAKRGTNLPLSVHIKAVDRYLLGVNVDELRTGDKLTNVEDREGNLFTDLTLSEFSYDVLNPANDEFVLENQEAVDKRNTSSSGNGTLSGRAGGMGELFDNSRDLFKSYDNITLDVANLYSLSAEYIKESSDYHQIITRVFDLLADESNVKTESDYVTSVKFKTFYINNKYSYGDYVRVRDKTYRFIGEHPPGMSWSETVDAGLVVETGFGESVDVKSIYGTHVHQDAEGTTTVIQDVTGILVDKVKPTITDFSADAEYNEGDYVRYKDAIYKCLYKHKGKFNSEHFGFVAEQDKEDDIWKYNTVYQTDERGNEVVNLITGEKEYQIVDGNLEGVPITNPIKSITRRTQTEFYDVIGTTATYQTITDTFDEDTSYTVGQGVKYDGKFYWFVENHQGPWDWTHVEPLRQTATVNGEQVYTLTSVDGSTLFHNEKEIDQIVGEVEVVQTKDNNGKVVSRDLVIKNGSGLRSRKGSVEVGIFENGELNAGLLVDSLNNNSGNIAALQFSQNKSYAVGDYVQYEGVVYQCTTAHNKAAWDPAHFTVAAGKFAKLKADIVDLGDYATVGTLNAVNVSISNRIDAFEGRFNSLTSGNVYSGSINVSGSLTSGGAIQGSTIDGTTVLAETLKIGAGEDKSTVGTKAVYIGGTMVPSLMVLATGTATSLSIPDAITGLRLAGPTNNQYTLYKTTFSNSSESSIGSFSRAISSFDRTWNSASLTVTASPQDQSDTIQFGTTVAGATTINNTATVNFVTFDNPEESTQTTTRLSRNVYLQVDNDYCYITSTDATPSASNTIAQIVNTKSGSGTITGITASAAGDDLRTTISLSITGTNISNPSFSRNMTLALGTSTSSGNTINVVTATLNNAVVGRISVQSVYTNGHTAGYNAGVAAVEPISASIAGT